MEFPEKDNLKVTFPSDFSPECDASQKWLLQPIWGQ